VQIYLGHNVCCVAGFAFKQLTQDQSCWKRLWHGRKLWPWSRKEGMMWISHELKDDMKDS